MKPSVGRIVHFVNKFGNERNCVAALVVCVWSNTCVNLRVFYDGTNDVPEGTNEWETSVSFDDKEVPDPRTWHWPPKI